MIQIGPFLSFTLAVTLLLSGKILTMNIGLLRRYSVPEPVAGGFLCAAVVALVYGLAEQMILFDLGARDFLLLVFFASIGLKADFGTLLRGGKPLIVLTGLAAVFLVAQNLLGMAMAVLFGLAPRIGLIVGSVSLTGGVGTTIAWAPTFVERFGLANAAELGIANTTAGLIVACVIGGPIAAWLIARHKLPTSHDSGLDIGVAHDRRGIEVDYFCLWAILALNIAVMAGIVLARLIAEAGFTLPTFVSCLFAGIIVGNLASVTALPVVQRVWPGVDQALSLLSDLALGLFLTMALMGMQLWELADALGFILTSLAAQTMMTVLFSVFLVFRLMGRDYQAAVIAAGFGGITLGSTATAIANMTAVTQQYGAAHRAFIIVPLVAGFFIDIINALVIAAFVQ